MKLLRVIGWTEIAIGTTTLVATLLSLLLRTNTKTPSVLFFVIITSIISSFLGVGILKLNRVAYLLLLYFSSVIFLTKALIFLGILHLNGALETAISPALKNWISLFYHAMICFYLARKRTQKYFVLNDLDKF